MITPIDGGQASLARASRRAAVATALGAVLTLLAIGYSALRLRAVEAEVSSKRAEVGRLEAEVSAAEREVEDLTSSQRDALDFLARVTAQESIRLIGEDVDWPRIRDGIVGLQPGRRKQAVLGGILLAWRDIPFRLAGKDMTTGFDSPRFVQFVLGRVGIEVKSEPGERLSVAMMRRFAQTRSPEPGDLLFYKGEIGHFVMIYLGPGAPGGQGVCLGTFETGQPVQIMDSVHFNTTTYPFIGYFGVTY